MKPKVEALISKYPRIKGIYLDMGKYHKLGIGYEIFTVPALLLYVDGKLTIREARHISMDDIESRIDRYYKMLY